VARAGIGISIVNCINNGSPDHLLSSRADDARLNLACLGNALPDGLLELRRISDRHGDLLRRMEPYNHEVHPMERMGRHVLIVGHFVSPFENV